MAKSLRPTIFPVQAMLLFPINLCIHTHVVAEVREALNMAPSDFEAKYGWPKPATGAGIVFYCQAGVRGGMAGEEAVKAGYQAFCYRGSWGEWKARCGQ